MRVKRYVVDTMPEAMLQIRNDLGSDAVILSTKETKLGGFLGMFKKKKIEVIAAVEADQQANTATKQRQAPAPAPQKAAVPQKAVPQAYKKTAELTLAATGAKASSDHAQPEAAPAHPAPRRTENSSVHAQAVTQAAGFGESAAANETLASSEQAQGTEALRRMEQLQPAEGTDPQARNNVEAKLLEELQEMKAWMAKISRQSMMKQQLPSVLEKLQERLIQQEVDFDLIEKWITSTFDDWEESGRTLGDAELFAHVRSQVLAFLSERFGGGIANRTRIVYVAGPTGVGKTTTIAKLAAEQLLRFHRKVGLITSDTYRISAVDQLRTYASILNVPLEVVQSPGDMQRAFQRLQDCDIILMDTAGRNFRNELLVSELQSLFSAITDHSETFLVLSLTSKSQDMKKITEHFSKYGLDKVIFTKLDETGSCGSIFNLIREYPLYLSYMTNGQNVPEDLLLPDSKKLCGMLLGEEAP
ncbi:flagellar biosynthesis protein FlhF [Paenibacillus sp. XY044]|uniref:flagellar biosynthesis protein FlhF n=1 Tax=Paenibacillus sp. XY044 TaxID=2026089 RepID=UPI000B98C8CA|nr:flagellar biosynthesis protein FlhF [Paenibacillus sp. XY044]OZB97817.1 flagellar biosynthesis protein FlhF [Paenibacillus sp. XY044]